MDNHKKNVEWNTWILQNLQTLKSDSEDVKAEELIILVIWL